MSQSGYSQSSSLPDSVKEKLPEQARSVFEESFPANCSIHFAESIFQTRFSGKIEKKKKTGDLLWAEMHRSDACF